jgi:hypothetical protein
MCLFNAIFYIMYWSDLFWIFGKWLEIYDFHVQCAVCNEITLQLSILTKLSNLFSKKNSSTRSRVSLTVRTVLQKHVETRGVFNFKNLTSKQNLAIILLQT